MPGLDTGSGFGPWIITADASRDLDTRKMIARVNGEDWGAGHASAISPPVEGIIAFISSSGTLPTSDIISSSIGDTGRGLERGRYLQADDIIDLEIEKSGRRRHCVVK